MTLANKPITLRDLGSFYVGGNKTQIKHTAMEMVGLSPATVIDGAMYVQYLIPEHRSQALPLVLIHGGSHSGKTWESTPDGREGWFTLLARAGFAVYNVDQVSRGRSGFNADPINRVRGGEGAASELPPIAQAGLELAYGFARQGPRFPFGAVEQYAAQLAPDFSVPHAIAQGVMGLSDPRNVEAIGALLDKIGPALLLTHSQGGDIGWKVARRYPDRVRGIVTIEPAVGCVGADAPDYPKIPTLIVWGDNLAPGRVLCTEQLEECFALQRAQPHIEVDHLPAAGITGNGHMLMMEDNSAELAQRIVAWLAARFPAAARDAG